MSKLISILGSTGSIGLTTLNILSNGFQEWEAYIEKPMINDFSLKVRGKYRDDFQPQNF